VNRLRRWAAPLLLVLLAFAFVAVVVADDCEDECRPSCGDCVRCPMAALTSRAPVAAAGESTAPHCERLGAPAAKFVRRPVEHVPLDS
jgi:hypothetical protein